MINKNNKFLAPLLNTPSNYLWFWMAIVVLQLFKIYEGDRVFFVNHFGEEYQDIEALKWAKWAWHNFSTFFLYVIVPIAIIKFKFKEPLKNYGLGLGEWKYGIAFILIGSCVTPIVAYNISQNAEHVTFYQAEFPMELAHQSTLYFILWILTMLPHYIGYDFFYRGFVQFGLTKRFDAFTGIMAQTTLTMLMHIGKPQGETWGSFVGGVIMGLVAHRTKSFWWVMIFHFILGVLNSYFCGI